MTKLAVPLVGNRGLPYKSNNINMSLKLSSVTKDPTRFEQDSHRETGKRMHQNNLRRTVAPKVPISLPLTSFCFPMSSVLNF